MGIKSPERLGTEPLLDDFGEMLAAVSGFKPKKKRGILDSRRGGSTAASAIRYADENGPGVVGFYLDLRSDMVGLLDIRLQKWNRQTQKWEWSDHPAASAAIEDLVSPTGGTLVDFAKGIERELEGVGEVGFAPVDTPNGTRYRLLALDEGSHEVVEKATKDRPARVAWKGTPKSKRPKDAAEAAKRTDWIELDESDVIRIFQPHPKWFDTAYTPLSRALPDLRRFENAGRALHRSIASQLINAGFLWFKGSAKDVMQIVPGARNRGGQKTQLGWLGEMIQSIMQAGEKALTDYDEEHVSSALPHPIVTESDTPPQLIDSGRLVDPELLNVKRDALEDWARAVNIPMSVLIEGQGAAQRQLNEWLQDKAFKQTTIMPAGRRASAALTSAFLIPRLREMQKKDPRLFTESLGDGQIVIPPSDFRLWPDEASITQDEPELDDIARGVEIGALDPSAYAKAMDAEDHALERPSDVSAFDMWQTRQGRRAKDFDHEDSPEAEVPRQRPASIGWYDSPT